MANTMFRALPTEIADIQAEMEERARSYGLDCYQTIFEMLDYEQLHMVAAYGGFPVRYPHWRFGAEYESLMRGYTYGLQKIYEMVINTDPCYAYLLDCNALTDQKLVIAHVYGHCDFFKNNAWFAPTNRKMLDVMANHAARIRKYMERFGYERVEEFIDACLSLEDLIDPHAPLSELIAARNQAAEPVATSEPKSDHHLRLAGLNEEESEAASQGRFASKGYMDPYINPPDVLETSARERIEKSRQQAEQRSFPEAPQRDVLLFLLEHATLQPWQHDILSIIRDEAYYFAPQGQTKIMNEGWASYWHSTIMTHHGLTDAEVIDYADHHSGTMATSPQRLNPYKLGIELLRNIEERWNRGQFGAEYNACEDYETRRRWDKQTGLGRQKIFEVRRIHNDVTFIDEFLTPDFCVEQKLFQFEYNPHEKTYEIASREFAAIKRQLLDNLTNHGRPLIYVLDGNYRNRGELYLQHQYHGAELRQDYARDTLVNLQKLWGRPVHLETVIDDQLTVFAWDGHSHEQRAAAA